MESKVSWYQQNQIILVQCAKIQTIDEVEGIYERVLTLLDEATGPVNVVNDFSIVEAMAFSVKDLIAAQYPSKARSHINMHWTIYFGVSDAMQQMMASILGKKTESRVRIVPTLQDGLMFLSSLVT